MDNNSDKKVRTKRLSNDTDKLKLLISHLSNESLTKTALAELLQVEPKALNDSVLLAATRLAGNTKFLDNLVVSKAGGGIRKNPQYAEKRGLIIPTWQFENKGITNGQRYAVEFGKKGIITLSPVDVDAAAGGNND